jgi:hypothetical protein
MRRRPRVPRHEREDCHGCIRAAARLERAQLRHKVLGGDEGAGWLCPILVHFEYTLRCGVRLEPTIDFCTWGLLHAFLHGTAPGRVSLRTEPIQARPDSIRHLVLL